MGVRAQGGFVGFLIAYALRDAAQLLLLLLMSGLAGEFRVVQHVVYLLASFVLLSIPGIGLSRVF